MSKSTTATIPHSWSIDSWPAQVFPTTPSRARRLIRVYRASLMEAGALARVGREIIVLGPRYIRWMEMHTADVGGYVAPPNTPEARATRARRERDEAAA